MTRLEWGLGPRPFDQGIDRGVLYLGDRAVPWNGLVSVDEEAAASVESTSYFDGNKINVAVKNTQYKARLQAYTYPDAFAEYNGYGPREIYKRFGLSYRTQYGDGYQIHLVYNALIQQGEMKWTTTDDTANPSLFNWSVDASEIPILGARPAAHIMIDSASLDWIIEEMEDRLYGTATTDAYLPEADELIEIFESAVELRVTYHGDGSYTVSGVDRLVEVLPDGRFRINAPTVEELLPGIFTVRSYA